MIQNIKEKVLKEGDEKWDIFWKFNRDRIDEDGDKFVELDKSVISKVSFIVGFGKAIDLTLIMRNKEFGKVIDDWFNKNKVLLRGSIPAMISKHGFSLEDIKELKQKLGIK